MTMSIIAHKRISRGIGGFETSQSLAPSGLSLRVTVAADSVEKEAGGREVHSKSTPTLFAVRPLKCPQQCNAARCQSMGHHPGEAVCWLQVQAQVVAPILIHQGPRKVGRRKGERSETGRWWLRCPTWIVATNIDALRTRGIAGNHHQKTPSRLKWNLRFRQNWTVPR